MRSPGFGLALIGVLAAACGGATQQQAASSWVVPQEQFFAKVGTIGIGSLSVPDKLENPAPVQTLFDSLVTQQLRLAGYKLVHVPEMHAVSDSEMQEHGKFNPTTGERDTAALRTATEHALRRLAQQYLQVDAFLMPDLVVVPARLEGYDAYWDGTTQSLVSFSDFLLLRMREYQGTIPAYSMCARFWDPAGSPMYHNHGGIQLASMPGKEVERSKLFVNAERNLNAVRLARGRYCGAPRPSP